MPRAAGVRGGRESGAASFQLSARHVDIAPTIAAMMRFSDDRGYERGRAHQRKFTFKRQDGNPLSEIISEQNERPARVYMILLDGLSHSELRYQLEENRAEIPNIASIVERGALLSHGSIVKLSEHHVAEPFDDHDGPRGAVITTS